MNIELIQQYIKYLPDTGEFVRIKKLPKSNAPLMVPFKGTLDSAGYFRVCVLGKVYRAHILAYALTFGHKPSLFIDHINRDRQDNRIYNLRPANRQINGQNQRHLNRKSATGVIGVYRVKKNTYKSLIQVNNKSKYLGTFSSVEEAYLAYCKAKENLQPASYVDE